MATIKALKNLHKDCKVKHIINDISGRTTYVEDENGNYLKKVFIPFTDSKIWSNWKVGVEVKYKRRYYTAWFTFSHHSEHMFLDHIWNGGNGKKLRSDAEWNIRRKYFPATIN